MNIRIRITSRPRSRQKRVYGANKYNTPLVMMMYLMARGITVSIKERANKKKNGQGRPRVFYHETYTRIRNNI
jgi:hypothetical protein